MDHIRSQAPTPKTTANEFILQDFDFVLVDRIALDCISKPACVIDHRVMNWQLLGGSWVATSGVISRVTIIIGPVRGLITLLITTHEPSSKANLGCGPSCCCPLATRTSSQESAYYRCLNS